jgi:hypothetical protein
MRNWVLATALMLALSVETSPLFTDSNGLRTGDEIAEERVSQCGSGVMLWRALNSMGSGRYRTSVLGTEGSQ